MDLCRPQEQLHPYGSPLILSMGQPGNTSPQEGSAPADLIGRQKAASPSRCLEDVSLYDMPIESDDTLEVWPDRRKIWQHCHTGGTDRCGHSDRSANPCLAISRRVLMGWPCRHALMAARAVLQFIQINVMFMTIGHAKR